MSGDSEQKWKMLAGFATCAMGFYLSADYMLKQQEEEIQGDNLESSESELGYDSSHVYNSKLFNLKTQISQQQVDADHNIYRICLTGGPCGGKTTALNLLKQRYEAKGYNVILAPELPTITMQGGGMIIMEGLSNENVIRFQSELMAMQIKLEDYYVELAKNKRKGHEHKPSIVFFDRGVLDPRAYQSPDCWQTIMDVKGWNEVMLRDVRYDAIIHLVTAANGASDFYTSENNVARYETVEMAVDVDNNLQRSWTGHPHHIVIANQQGGWDRKIQRVYDNVDKIVGIQQTEYKQRKFLISISDLINSDIDTKVYHVEEVFLNTTTPDEIIKIRKRGLNQVYSYYKETKVKAQQGRKVEINAMQYQQLRQNRDPAFKVITKKRICFLYDSISFVIDNLQLNEQDIQILRIKGLEADVQINAIKVPSFIKIMKEVTYQSEYSTIEIARQS